MAGYKGTDMGHASSSPRSEQNEPSVGLLARVLTSLRQASSNRAFAGLRTVGLVVLVGAAYFAAGKLGLEFASVNRSASPVWPPSGIALAALLLFGYRVSPGVFLGAFLVNITTAGPPAMALGIATGNTVAALSATYMVTRFAGGRKAFDRIGSTFRFALLGSLLSTTVSASIGVLSLALTEFAPWHGLEQVWLTWWLGDSIGILLFTPAVIAWSRGFPRWQGWAALAERLAAVTALLVVGEIVFDYGLFSDLFLPIPYLVIPILVWAAIQFDFREVYALILLLAAIAIRGTTRGDYPWNTTSENAAFLFSLGFVAVVTLISLVISIVVSRFRKGLHSLQKVRSDLEDRVLDRTRRLTRANEWLSKEVGRRALAEKELRTIMGELISLQDQKQEWIAKQIHDDVNQQLALLALQSQLLDIADPAAWISKDQGRSLRATADGVASRLDGLVSQLRPSVLDFCDLDTAITSLIGEIETQNGVAVAFSAENLPAEIPSGIRLCLYRATQESLNIAIQCSAATRFVIQLLGGENKITLSIQAQNVDIDLNSALDRKAKLSFFTMQERIRQLAGNLTVTSRQGGTTLIALIPLPTSKDSIAEASTETRTAPQS
jgi:two-component system, NarL family, sensor histidine kinase FusK